LCKSNNLLNALILKNIRRFIFGSTNGSVSAICAFTQSLYAGGVAEALLPNLFLAFLWLSFTLNLIKMCAVEKNSLFGSDEGNCRSNDD